MVTTVDGSAKAGRGDPPAAFAAAVPPGARVKSPYLLAFRPRASLHHWTKLRSCELSSGPNAKYRHCATPAKGVPQRCPCSARSASAFSACTGRPDPAVVIQRPPKNRMALVPSLTYPRPGPPLYKTCVSHVQAVRKPCVRLKCFDQACAWLVHGLRMSCTRGGGPKVLRERLLKVWASAFAQKLRRGRGGAGGGSGLALLTRDGSRGQAQATSSVHLYSVKRR
jgi:hypothetical protein